MRKLRAHKTGVDLVGLLHCIAFYGVGKTAFYILALDTNYKVLFSLLNQTFQINSMGILSSMATIQKVQTP